LRSSKSASCLRRKRFSAAREVWERIAREASLTKSKPTKEVIANNVFGEGDRVLRFGAERMLPEVCFQVMLRKGLEDSDLPSKSWQLNGSATLRHSRRTTPRKDQASGGELDDVPIVANRIGIPPQGQRLTEVEDANPLISERVDVVGGD